MTRRGRVIAAIVLGVVLLAPALILSRVPLWHTAAAMKHVDWSRSCY